VIIAVRVGSKGTGEESYAIRIPINISPSSKIEITPGEIPLNIGGYPAAIFEDQKLELYILEVYGFLSKEAASESLSSIQAGLVWAAPSYLASFFPPNYPRGIRGTNPQCGDAVVPASLGKGVGPS
jgi:hypothetical protein